MSVLFTGDLKANGHTLKATKLQFWDPKGFSSFISWLYIKLTALYSFIDFIHLCFSLYRLSHLSLSLSPRVGWASGVVIRSLRFTRLHCDSELQNMPVCISVGLNRERERESCIKVKGEWETQGDYERNRTSAHLHEPAQIEPCKMWFIKYGCALCGSFLLLVFP